MNRSDVCHVWAQQEKKSGKAGNVFFEGPVIYSYGYHFPMACFTKDRAGQECVLLTKRGYSSSTACHINEARQAVSHKTVYRVDNVLCYHKHDHQRNFDFMKSNVESMISCLPCKRTESTKSTLIDDITDLARSANEYAEAFKLRGRIKLTDDLIGLGKELAETAKRKTAADDRKRIKAEAERLKKWRAGETHQGSIFSGKTLMRIWTGEDGERLIQTTRGASFPAVHAMKAWPFIKRCRDNSTDWHRNGQEIRVGHFQLDTIDALGNVKAGCHDIEFDEIERIAKLLGL